MAVRKLSLDDFFEEEQYALIGIHCNIEDYRLAFLLNQALDLKLKRKQEDVCNPSQNSNFSIFEWYDEKQLITYSLVSNACKVHSNNLAAELNSLFSNDTINTKTHYLVPEYKTVNYLLKIETEFQNREKIILNKTLKISQIITAYSIVATNLKSKENLIFS